MKGVIGMPAENSYNFKDVESIVEQYGNMLYRICFVMLGNKFDAEDALQETFIKYLQKAPSFDSETYEKAWLIKVASNKCHDLQRYRQKHRTEDIDELWDLSADEAEESVLPALCALPDKYKSTLYLYYVEGYKVEEIAKMIGKTSSAVKMRLKKGRDLLRTIIEEEEYGNTDKSNKKSV